MKRKRNKGFRNAESGAWRRCRCRAVLHLAVILAVAFALWGCATLPGDRDDRSRGDLTAVRVVRVIDGDTMVIRMPDRSEERLRLIGIDAPEVSGDPVDPFGAEAAAYAAGLLEGREVFLETDVEERDRHGRLPGYLWLERPAFPVGAEEVRRKMFNARMLLDGYALLMTVPPNVRYVDCFRELQREAREHERGLWGVPVDAEEYYVGNANTRRFHRPDCPDAAKIAPANRVRLNSRDEAFDKGFEPCRTCNP